MHLYLVCDERYWNLKLTNFSEKRPKYRAPIVISATGEKVKWVKLNVILTKTEAVLAPGYFSHHLGSGVQEQASCQQSTQQSKRYFLYKNEFIKDHFLIILAKNYLKVLFFDLYPWQGGTVELCCVSITFIFCISIQNIWKFVTQSWYSHYPTGYIQWKCDCSPLWVSMVSLFPKYCIANLKCFHCMTA